MAKHDEMEARIRDFFEQNFEMLRLESGHSLSPDAKAAALNQVLLYWRRLREIAEKVTDTEVRLNLPNLQTPKGRKFGIDGIVDIVREPATDGEPARTVMYDVKTHEADDVRANLDEYGQQLNVYAHIWQNLREQMLTETAVISTAFPEEVKRALQAGDEAALERALQRWQPVIPIPFDTSDVAATVAHFAGVVDRIEDGDFAAPSVAKLRRRPSGMQAIFAVQVCRNCDARFSCASYRAYAREGRGAAEQRFRHAFFDAMISDSEREDRLLAGLAMNE